MQIPARGMCVMAAMDKFTWATEILWGKWDGTATLSRGEDVANYIRKERYLQM